MIDVFNIKNCHFFPGNLLASQFRLRYRLNIERQNWSVPTLDKEFEYDSYDNPATFYFTYKDENNVVRGCQRLYPTTRPYMLQEVFPLLVTNRDLPNDSTIWEGSRICVDTDLPSELRKRIIHELALAYMEFALSRNIKMIIGVMLPAYWKSVYINSGWNPVWFGEVIKLDNGDRVRAGGLPVSEEVLANIRRITGIYDSVLNTGNNKAPLSSITKHISAA